MQMWCRDRSGCTRNESTWRRVERKPQTCYVTAVGLSTELIGMTNLFRMGPMPMESIRKFGRLYNRENGAFEVNKTRILILVLLFISCYSWTSYLIFFDLRFFTD